MLQLILAYMITRFCICPFSSVCMSHLSIMNVCIVNDASCDPYDQAIKYILFYSIFEWIWIPHFEYLNWYGFHAGRIYGSEGVVQKPSAMTYPILPYVTVCGHRGQVRPEKKRKKKLYKLYSFFFFRTHLAPVFAGA